MWKNASKHSRKVGMSSTASADASRAAIEKVGVFNTMARRQTSTMEKLLAEASMKALGFVGG